MNIDVSYLITRKQQYVEIKLEPALEFTLSVKKSIEATKTLFSLSTAVAGCVQIGFDL